MINFNIHGIKNSLFPINVINFNFNRKNLEGSNIKASNINNYLDKHHLISFYSSFSELPLFEIENATMDKTLVNAFYNVAIKLTKEMKFTDSQFSYFKKNFLAFGVKSKMDMIEYLTKEREQINRNDGRYLLGFRSVFAALKNNIDKIGLNYLAEINCMLTPFFISYMHKELLIFGLTFIEKNDPLATYCDSRVQCY